MRSHLNILGIIPAREGSKRVPQKNFRPFAETTLVDLAINQALSSHLIDKIIVNSDAEQVAKIASKYDDDGVRFLKRPTKLATDESPAIDYMIQTLDFLKERGEVYDLVVIIQPSSPLRSGSDIDSTIQLLLDESEADSAVSVAKLAHMIHPHKLKTMDKQLLNPWLVDEGQKTAAHELPDLFVRNCAVYVFRKAHLEKGITYGARSLGYVMPADTSVDINDVIEFEFAEYLFNKKES